MTISRVSELNTRSHTELCMYADPNLIRIEDIPIYVGMRHCVSRHITNIKGSTVDIRACEQSCEHFGVCHPIPLETPEERGVSVILPKVEP